MEDYHREYQCDHRLEVQIVGCHHGTDLYHRDGPQEECRHGAYQAEEKQIVDHGGAHHHFERSYRRLDLLAKSLCEQAHLYVWDEPLNYIDVLSRVQIEELLLKFRPTILFVEHDTAFRENVATKIIEMSL